MNKKNILLSVLSISIFVLIIFLINHKNPPLTPITSLEKKEKISVVTSFYPLYNFAKNITADHATVINITPPGTEPHDYEPTPQDIVRIQNAAIFIFNGNGVDAWAEKITPELISKGVVVIKMSDYVELIPNTEYADTEHEDKDVVVEKNIQFMDKKQAHDPHFWLDPINAQTEVRIITDAIKKVDPKNRDNYSQNEKEYLAALATLHQDYEKWLTSCTNRTIITSHNAFSYLAKRYNLESHYISGLSPEDEPSPKQMAIIAEKAKKENIHYIFFETLISPELSQTIASEIGASTLVLNPIEGLSKKEIEDGKDYISEMRENLKNLKIALSCQ